jgi:hypothetical protein
MERKVAIDPQGVKTELSVPRQVFVRPMPFRRWGKVMAHMSGLLQALPDSLDLSNIMQIGFLAAHLIGNSNDAIFSVLELATDENPELFDRIDPDDGVRIVAAVIEVNRDFFVQKVLPLLSEVAPFLKAKVESLTSTSGQTQ